MIKTFDYIPLLKPIEDEIMAAIRRVLYSGWLILGPETEAFEAEFARLVGTKHCVAVTSGTVALQLALMGLGIGPGDEVITVANTCVPTVAAIALTGAIPVLVDARDDDLMIDVDLVEAAITARTKCILPVHLWGQCVDLERLRAVADRHDLFIVEDCAQAQGALYKGQHVGAFGNVGCFSFYPTKNLGAYGDAGAVVTNNDDLATGMRRQRMYGYTRPNYAEELGMNGRIAEFQAAILRVKMRYLPEWLVRRRAIAQRYQSAIRNPAIALPHLYPERDHAFHQYVIRCDNRPRVMAALEAREIGYSIHYPTPIHQMPAYRHLAGSLPVIEMASAQILSIPIHEALIDAQVNTVIAVLNKAV